MHFYPLGPAECQRWTSTLISVPSGRRLQRIWLSSAGRFGVPLLDLGTVRLPRLIGHSHAMDLILTGRDVRGEEALSMGLVNRLVPTGQALDAAIRLARELAEFPQRCLRSDRLSAYEQWSLSYPEALRNELRRGVEVVESGETVAGATSFTRGQGRHGAF